MRRASFVGAVAMLASLLLALPAQALPTSVSEGFGNPPWTAGTPLVAQNGWTYTGGALYDVGIVGSGIDGQSVRISNAVMSGSFGDWLFSPEIEPATETGNQEFTAEFKIKSASGAYQPGMQMNVAPTRSDGARMTNLRFEDRLDGIHVIFSDALNLDEMVTFQNAPFRLVDIRTLSYTETHRVTIKMNLYPGPHNDVVQVYIDGSAGLVPGQPGEATFDGFYAPVDNQPTTNKAKAGQTIPLKWRLSAPSFATSWEDYYRYDKESNGGELVADPLDPINGYGTRPVDSLIFQARCPNSCVNTGLLPIDDTDGYLIDDVTYSASDTLGLPIASVGEGDASIYGTPPITVTGENCGDLPPGDLDPIEVYAANANGLMYHGNGVWQFNWQTPKSLAGKCVEVALAPAALNGSTLFMFTK